MLKLMETLFFKLLCTTPGCQVRAACLSMLPSYPGQSFLLTTLRTLTSLATHTLVDVPDQVSSVASCIMLFPFQILLSFGNIDPSGGIIADPFDI